MASTFAFAAPHANGAAAYSGDVSPVHVVAPLGSMPQAYAASGAAQFAAVPTAQLAGSAPAEAGEEIRTLFVTGFPPDVQMRELHTLLRFFPGYEASQMSTKMGASATAPQGFALFTNQAYARQAMLRINDLAFDHDHHLRVELAHKNMYLKDDPSIYKADRPATPVSPAVPTMVGPPTYTAPLLSSLAALRPAGGIALSPAFPGAPLGATPIGGFAPVTNRFDNVPCNTLFIGNLGDSVDEQELQMLFGSQPGFKQLKLIRNPRQVSCFVEYTEVAAAAAVHTSLQGAILASSDRGPIRVQYSKNPFGKRSNTALPPGMHPAAGFLHGTGLVQDFTAWPGAFNLHGM